MFELSSVVVVAVRGGEMLAAHSISRFSVCWAHSCQTKYGHGVHGLSRGVMDDECKRCAGSRPVNE